MSEATKTIIIEGPLEQEEYYANSYRIRYSDSEKWEGVFLMFQSYDEGDKKLVKELLARLGFNSTPEI